MLRQHKYTQELCKLKAEFWITGWEKHFFLNHHIFKAALIYNFYIIGTKAQITVCNVRPL